jgi:hypothetical protein
LVLVVRDAGSSLTVHELAAAGNGLVDSHAVSNAPHVVLSAGSKTVSAHLYKTIRVALVVGYLTAALQLHEEDHGGHVSQVTVVLGGQHLQPVLTRLLLGMTIEFKDVVTSLMS